MGWIRCVRCKNIPHNFAARTYALIAPVRPILHWVCCRNKKQSQMHPNTKKCNKRWVLGPTGWIGCVRCENIRRDFVARTFALIAPVQPILHRVSCSNEMVPSAPKHSEMHQNLEWIGLICCKKILTQLCGLNFCIYYNSSSLFNRVS